MIITVTQMINHYAQNQMNKIGQSNIKQANTANDSIHPIKVVIWSFMSRNIVHV